MEKEQLLQDPIVQEILAEEALKIKQETEQKVREEEKGVREGLVEEIKTLRSKKVETPAHTDEIPVAVQVETALTEILSKQKQEEAKANRDAAWTKFLSENNEFHPDNDPTGLKAKALQEELSRLKEEGLHTQDEYYKLFAKAKVLASTQQDTEVLVADPSTKTEPANPRAQHATKLTPKEQKLISQNGWSEEKYLALKQKPGMEKFIEGLLQHVN